MDAHYRIFDADRHVIEPIDLWKEYLAPEFRGHAPYYEYFHHGTDTPLEERLTYRGPQGEIPLPPDLMVDGEPVMASMAPGTRAALALTAWRRRAAIRAGQDPTGQLQAMDRDGIEVAVLYPTFAMYLVSVDTMASTLADAFAQAYNTWLRDFCRVAPERLRGAGLIARHDPVSMLRALEWIVECGWKTVVLRPNPVKGRILSHPDYEPFWAACERLSVAVAIHEGTHTRLPTAGADRFTTRFAVHACSHPMEQMMALLALIEGGVLERHPTLRVVFLEAGCSWLPYWLWRLDEVEYKHLAGEVAEYVQRKPSDYFRRQCFVAVEPDEPHLPETIRLIGTDNVVFGTDFPHIDHDAGIVRDTLRLQGRVSDLELRKLLWDNAARLYGF
jgi:uncharacterized protein